jgi:hypothetical protein
MTSISGSLGKPSHPLANPGKAGVFLLSAKSLPLSVNSLCGPLASRDSPKNRIKSFTTNPGFSFEGWAVKRELNA